MADGDREVWVPFPKELAEDFYPEYVADLRRALLGEGPPPNLTYPPKVGRVRRRLAAWLHDIAWTLDPNDEMGRAE